MAEAIRYSAAAQKFGCGKEYANLTVVNFTGPAGSRACAYSCNMNIDLDGEPQAYGPHFKPDIKPLDYLEDAGWLGDDDNSKKKTKYEDAKKAHSELEKKRQDLEAATKPAPDAAKPAPEAAKPTNGAAKPTNGAAKPTNGAAKPPPDPAKVALDKQIVDAKKLVKSINPYPANAPNYEKIFWHWYGLVALTPLEAKRMSYHEKVGKSTVVRRPVLDQTSYYEDVYGKFPVVQSEYEPGPGYFVSRLATAGNPAFRDCNWDQRYYLPPDSTTQQSYAALTVPLHDATGLNLRDIVFAIHLETGDSQSFPFLDSGFKAKVAECSIGAFSDLGGRTGPMVHKRPTYINDFQVLYLAFPNSAGQTPAATLAKFATASNALDFPIILAFIAQVTADAKADPKKKSKDGLVTVSGDPLKAWEKYQKQKPELQKDPDYLDVINQGLADAGFKPPTTSGAKAAVLVK